MKNGGIVTPDAVVKEFPGAFTRVMSDLAKHKGMSLSPEVVERGRDVITSIFRDNPVRVAYEFKELDVGDASDADVAFAIATLFSHIILTNAFYEGRTEITIGDVYLALIDVEKAHAWPWT